MNATTEYLRIDVSQYKLRFDALEIKVYLSRESGNYFFSCHLNALVGNLILDSMTARYRTNLIIENVTVTGVLRWFVCDYLVGKHIIPRDFLGITDYEAIWEELLRELEWSLPPID